jgi:hypothetical protein
MTGLLVTMALTMGQADPGAPSAAPTPNGPAATNPRTTTTPFQWTSVPATADKTQPANSSSTEAKGQSKPEEVQEGGFFRRLFKAYYDEFSKTPSPIIQPNWENEPSDEPEKPRRQIAVPFTSPPFPVHEYQGYPLVGVPPEDQVYPLMKAIYGANTPFTDAIKDSKIKLYGWVTSSGNWSTANNSNAPTSYWIVPNRYELDQLVFRLERELDSVQKEHIDWGFRSTLSYGMDYRYFTAGGWFSDQLLKHNDLYGWDPTEQYLDVYFPGILDGMIFRLGRWIACPDIETQFSPDNYLGSHSILFTYDTYTQTGFMFTFLLNKQWMLQLGMNAGNDMAPWYKGAVPCGYAGIRWVSEDGKLAYYGVLNQINDAHFRHFFEDGQPAGHDNFNYYVQTVEWAPTKRWHTKTESYFMWQRDAEVGGTPSIGPVKPFGGGGGDGVHLPGLSLTYGVLNYTAYGLSKQDYITLRNEWWRDERGMRSGAPGTYTSHTIGWSHNFNALFQVRPEIGYYRNWANNPLTPSGGSFDNGTKHGIWLYGFDMTLRF